MPSVAIIRNGTVVADPDYPHKMHGYAADDMPDLRTLMSDNSVLAGIDLSGDWETHEMAKINRLLAAISGRYRNALNMHWFGYDTEGSLAPRALSILNSMAGDGVAVAWGDDDASGAVTAIGTPDPADDYLKCVAGDGFAAILHRDGVVYCYGDDSPAATISFGGGQLVIDVAASNGHAVVIGDDGDITATGDSSDAWTAILSNTTTAAPVAVVTGVSFYAVLFADSTIEIWGTLPSGVAFNSAWQGHINKIVAGGMHLLLLLDDGRLVACGDNAFGQCNVPSQFGNVGSDVGRFEADLVRSYAMAITASGPTVWGAQFAISGTFSRFFTNPNRCAVVGRTSAIPSVISVEGHRGPAKLVWGSAAYDSIREVGVHFGGATDFNNTEKTRETWERGATKWNPVFGTAVRPAAKSEGCMAFDPPSGLMVEFGTGAGNAARELHTFGGTSWVKPTNTGTTHAASFGVRAVFDPTRGSSPTGRVVFFGGKNDSTPLQSAGDYNPTTRVWSSHTIGGSPGARQHHGFAYDTARNVYVLFGGNNNSAVLGDTREAPGGDGTTTFTLKTPDHAPSGRTGCAMVYDAANGVCVLYGGKESLEGGGGGYKGDTWTWDGTDWTEKTGLSGVPRLRSRATMYYDSAREVVVMHGGFGELTSGGSFGMLNDTWEWDGTDWTQVVTTDAPTGSIPAATADMGHVDFAIGDGFGVMIDRHGWSCGTLARALVGLCQAHGIPAMVIGGNGTDCSGDVMLQIWSVVHQTWILVFPHGGCYLLDGTGKPMGLTEVRAAHDAAQYQIAAGSELDAMGFSVSALLGSGISGYPDSISTSRIFPFVDPFWWSLAVRTPSPADTDIISTRYGWHLNEWNKATPQSATLGDLKFDDFSTIETNCPPVDFSGATAVDDDSTEWNYPLNNVHAEVELISAVPPYDVEITLTHNMVADTGGLDELQASTDAGETWAAIATVLTDEGGGVYTWNPTGTATLLIRGINDAGVTSPVVEIKLSESMPSSSVMMMVRRRQNKRRKKIPVP